MEWLGSGKFQTEHIPKILLNRRVIVDEENSTGENGVRIHAINGT